MSDNLRGALLMIAAMAAFTINDALMKAVSEELPLFEAMLIRGLATTAFFLLLAWRMGGLRLPPGARDRRLVAWRSAAEVGAAVFFLTALFNMPLANATAILQSLPLAVTAAGALFLGERVGVRRWAAVAVGLAGVLLIVRPGTEGFTVFSLYALASVACVTLRDVVTRQLSPGVPSVTVALCAAVGVTLLSAAGAGIGAGLGGAAAWVAPSGRALLLLAGASGLLIAGYLLSVMTMRRGEVSFVSPFRYTGLLWALVLGWAAFGDWPDGPTLAGAAIVVASGSFTLWRAGRQGSVAATSRPRG
jgi:drug/metabolite transporter (DMT)-like permease